MRTPEINGIRVSYNDKFVLRLKNKEIKEKRKKLNEQKKIEKLANEKLNKLLKMKPKQYKAISKKEKEEIKYEFEHEKARREVYEEEIEKLEKMEALDYLSLLNDETKEKLIGLCLDKKLLEDFNEEGETLYDEDEMGDDLDEEMEIEEAND